MAHGGPSFCSVPWHLFTRAVILQRCPAYSCTQIRSFRMLARCAKIQPQPQHCIALRSQVATQMPPCSCVRTPCSLKWIGCVAAFTSVRAMPVQCVEHILCPADTRLSGRRPQRQMHGVRVHAAHVQEANAAPSLVPGRRLQIQRVSKTKVRGRLLDQTRLGHQWLLVLL